MWRDMYYTSVEIEDNWNRAGIGLLLLMESWYWEQSDNVFKDVLEKYRGEHFHGSTGIICYYSKGY